MNLLTEQDIRRIIKKNLMETTLIGDTSDPLIDSIVDRVIGHEGKEEKMYKDTKGIPTIGVGFNLKRKDSDELLKQVGANPRRIKSGREKLNDKQIKRLLRHTLAESKNDAKLLVKNFDTLPENVQGVLIEMVFNLGKYGLSKFKNFLNYIQNKQWVKASKEMLNSAWAKQVGNRSKTLSDIIKSTVTSDPNFMNRNIDVYMGKQFDKNTGLKIEKPTFKMDI